MARGRSSAFLKRLTRDQRGSVYAFIAASFVPLMGVIGGGVDFGRAYLANSKLQMAVDAAAIAGARAQQVDSDTGDTSATWQSVDQYLRANFPNEYMGYASAKRDISVSRRDTEITVKLDVTGRLPTTFLQVVGIRSLPVTARATAEVGERLNAIEAMLVLDNTGSMADNGGMVAMKAAAKDFVDIIYSNQETVDDVAIGMLPYNITVNVGRLVQAEHPEWIDDYGASGLRSFYRADSNSPLSWKGCVFADETKRTLSSNVNTMDADVFDIGKTMPGERTVGGTKDMPKIRPYIYPQIAVKSFDSVNNRYRFSDYNFVSDYLINAIPHVRGALYDRYGQAICEDGSSGKDCAITVEKISDYSSYAAPKLYGHKSGQSLTGPSPNYECPAEALPLKYDRSRSALKKYVDEENYALPNIGTIHTPAMTWGYRMLARPDVFPRSTPTSRPVKKVMIFLTDGNFDSKDQGRNGSSSSASGPYDTAWTAYGTYEDKLVTNSTARSNFINAMIPRFSKTCQAAKRDGIEVYMITFALSSSSESNATRAMFRGCATDPNTHYFSTANSADLRAAFRSIAANLVDLHLSR